jgi:exodeoxyribonuclease VII large subunit
VGHEIDVTLSDLVADVRALTPSNAAELVVPEATAILATLRDRQSRLRTALLRRAMDARERLNSTQSRRPFKRPFDRVYDLAQQLDQWQSRCRRAIGVCIERSASEVTAMAGQLESLSPLGVLARGYSLTRRIEDDRPVTDAGQLNLGEMMHTRFHRGTAISRVEQIESQNSAESEN